MEFTKIMDNINIKLPDGKSIVCEKGISVGEVAYKIGQGLGKSAISGKVDGILVDLSFKLDKDCNIEILTPKSEGALEILRHTTAHIMAQAVSRLFNNAKYAIGPSIDNGFYYDFDVEKPFTPEDLEKIENEMAKIVKEDLKFQRKDITGKEAIDLFSKSDDKYKVEIIQEVCKDLNNDKVSIYSQGDFTDLCRGPHLPSTSYVKAFKLTSIAGAYWRGDSNREMLSRIYGTSFFDKKELEEYLNKLEEAKKRDHRNIGKELDLFSFHNEGPGFPFWHPKGKIIFDLLVAYNREENTKRGYQEISTPMILDEELWHRSGHYGNYKDNMYFVTIDEKGFAVKPMNCPGGMLIFKSKLHSYRELPIRNSEFGLVHRHELHGVLHGLFRVRAFTQDDAHIFCTKEQLQKEIIDTTSYLLDVYKTFGFEEYLFFIATKPDNHIGSDEDWETATNELENSLKKLDIPFKIKDKEGAFYGPKIEVNIKDCLGRLWQLGTIQVDFSMPLRFEISYEGEDGKKHTPIMIHRAIFGSLERFIGILIEHTEGKFPLWISPVQVKVIPVSNHFNDYADEVYAKLKNKKYRVEIDKRDEKLGYKIRQAQLEKIPYMIVVGENESNNKNISVRSRSEGDLGNFTFEDFFVKLDDEISAKKYNIKKN